MLSLRGKHTFTGLKLLDEAIAAYFTRNTNVDWTDIQKLLEVPSGCQQWLYTTPSNSTCKSPADEGKILKKLSDYIISVKPKYVVSDTALLIVVEKWLTLAVRQYAIGIPVPAANENLTTLTNWLHRVYSDEKSAGILSRLIRRSAPFSQKMQLIAETLELFIAQQSSVPGRPPRRSGDTPVTNSKIEAFKSVAQQKANAEYQNILGPHGAANFFTNVRRYHLDNLLELFALLVKPLYPDEKILRTL
ncbi:hypothetical protein L596_002705 [Steinernema carpocapsae]|uniref:Uncharacterized protein n=1 Tax=Steinernema carpocapsae TaxID=34508 RepID=A0A4U8USX6_STECR|nr:hypothetical protein L596_002705 [Steinernema carpocapsae]